MTPWNVTHQGPLSLGILQARILEWAAKPGIELRSPRLQADSLLSELPAKPEYWSGYLIPSLGDKIPDPGIESGSPALQVDFLPPELPGKPPCEC